MEKKFDVNSSAQITFEMFGSFNLENFSVLEEDAPVEKKREALTLDAEDFTELCEQQFTGVSIDYEPVDYANYYIATNC